MTNKNLRIFLFIVTSLFSLNIFAATWHASYIKHIYPLADGGFVLIPETPSSVCANSQSNQYFYVRVGYNSMTQEGLNKIYAAALGAHLAHRRVSFNFDESSNSCWINRLQVYS